MDVGYLVTIVTTIIFGTLQNNVWLIYIFRIFFRLVVWFYYGHAGLLFFKVEYQNNYYQILKWEIHLKIKKEGKCVNLKVNLEFFILNCYSSVLRVLAWYVKEVFAATGIKNNFRVFDKLGIWLNLIMVVFIQVYWDLNCTTYWASVMKVGRKQMLVNKSYRY